MNTDPQFISRRELLKSGILNVGSFSLATLLANEQQLLGETNPVANPSSSISGKSPYPPKASHFPAKAKCVIQLFMAGAPSQLDMFDHKPTLAKYEGKPIPPSVIQGQRYAFIQPDAAVLGPRFPFARYGESGAELASVLPHLSKVVDDISIVRSVHTDLFNHSPAQLFLNTGSGIPGRPSMGSWMSYGLGSEADDLPSYIVLKSGGSLSGGASMWSAGFLPSIHQGVPFRNQGDPVLHVSNPAGIDKQAQRDSLDLIKSLNEQHFQEIGDPEIQTRISAYEMAFRMQSKAPELMDFSTEKAETLEEYGANPKDAKAAFANNCLLARRLAERGVRFIQIYHAGWDHHSNVAGGVRSQTNQTDKPAAALIADLKQRGMLEETLVVWGGEFGRTPMIEASAALGRNMGRDHHPQAFTMWFAGGGIQPGRTVGKTDEFGFNVVEDPVHIHDVQATILHCMGIDHRRLSFRFRGLNFRLTGVEEHQPVSKLIS